jgi:hypothetical protein
MTTLQQKLRLAPSARFAEADEPGTSVAPVGKRYVYPPLIFIAPALSGLVLLSWIPSVVGVVVAIVYGYLGCALAMLVFRFLKLRLSSLIPNCTQEDVYDLARFVLTPVWIAEAIRLCTAEALFIFARQDPILVLRNVLNPLGLLHSPSELLTLLGACGLVLRLYFGARHFDSKQSTATLISTGLGVLALVVIVDALCSLAAMLAVGSLMKLNFLM